MKIKHILGLCAMAVACGAMTSCDDDTYDVVGNPDNLVYVNIAHDYPDNMPKNTYAYTVYHTPVGPLVISQPENVEIYVQCTKKATRDITVTLEVSPETVVAGYESIPESAGLKVTLSNNTVTIPQGSTRSNSVIATVDASNVNWASLTKEAYLLPIKVVKADGAIASQDVNCAYIGISTEVKDGMLNTEASSIPGTQIADRSGWTATYNVPATGAGGDCTDKIFDGNTRTYYLVFNHADKVNEEVITEIDLGRTYNLTGMQFLYFGWYYAIKDGTLETSVDGVNYTNQGTLTWSSLRQQCNFVFWAPTEMRYIRLTSHSFYGGTGEGQVLAEFYGYE